MTKMLLVGGTGRCGTSILKEVLACHPDAASLPFEYRFIIDPDGLVDFYASFSAVWSPFIADRRLKRLQHFLETLSYEPWYHKWVGDLIRWLDPKGRIFSPRSYHGWRLKEHLPDFDLYVRALMDDLVAFTFPAYWVGTESYQYQPTVYHTPPKTREELAPVLDKFIRHVIEAFLMKEHKAFLVEDNTWNIFFAREILELIPEAKIIHVYRDPRDVVASFSQQRWSPGDKLRGAWWYKAMMEHWFTVRAALPRNSYYEVSLEKFVAAPEATLKTLCAFADISFDAAMLQMDLSHAHSGRWKEEYSEAEKVKVHQILGDIIRALGYMPEV